MTWCRRRLVFAILIVESKCSEPVGQMGLGGGLRFGVVLYSGVWVGGWWSTVVESGVNVVVSLLSVVVWSGKEAEVVRRLVAHSQAAEETAVRKLAEELSDAGVVAGFLWREVESALGVVDGWSEVAAEWSRQGFSGRRKLLQGRDKVGSRYCADRPACCFSGLIPL